MAQSKNRPNPDNLLERSQAEERKRGRLKIYIGMAAGVGKTYSMLADARAERSRGVDVVIGYVEPHGRIETEQLTQGFEVIALAQVRHKELIVNEFNLDAALVRHPQLLIIDELAHSNPVGSRHEKRWQDIQECLDRGINVVTTINVQHIESLSDVVAKITGVIVHEVVPDAFVRNADEIELVDITPQELIQRFKDGKVYGQDKVNTALANFFKPGNLLALRELVLRLTAERVDEQLSTFRRQNDIRELWPARPRIVVCVSPNLLAARVVRAAARLAGSMRTELVAVTIDTDSGDSSVSVEANESTVRTALDTAVALGAKVIRRASNDIVTEILQVAREQNATMIVVGKPIRSRLRDYLFGSLVDEIIRRSGDLDVYVITDQAKHSVLPLVLHTNPPTIRGIISALVVTAVSTLACMLVEPYLALSNLIMFYLVGVVWAGTKLGQLESALTSLLGVLAFDFFFVPPRWTFSVSDAQYLLTFLVMLIIGLLISSLTLMIKTQAERARSRERRTAALFDVSSRLASTSSIKEIANLVREKVIELFNCEGVLLVPDTEGKLSAPISSNSGFEQAKNEMAVMQWVAEHKTRAGSGTDTLAGAQGMYIPTAASGKFACIVAIKLGSRPWDNASVSLLEAFVSQVGSALERLFAEQESNNSQLEMERERVRNVLLSSVSHDFRTPLSAILGAADTLINSTKAEATKDPEFKDTNLKNFELLSSIRDEAAILQRLVRNVLDLTKLESGNIRLQLEWESIEELIGTAVERVGDLLAPRKIDLQIDPGLPLIKVDAALILQALINLLENIVRHTPIDTQVIITAQRAGQDLVVTISDTGPGLPSGQEQRVFEKAFQGNSSATGQGFGLGLTICQTILREHGGTITADNQPSGGARFVLHLPIPDNQPQIDGMIELQPKQTESCK